MGLRLEGRPISPHGKGQMITEGVALGAIQIPDSGQPIILFVEQQTTGGYPKIANVISADLHSVGQLRPRDEIRFEKVDWEAARTLFKEQEEIMASGELME
jgi:antagonist of KipI